MPAATAITAGILPLKLDSGSDSRECDRARLLLASLHHFWRGRRPFDLHVVAVDDEYDAVCRSLGRPDNCRLRVRISRETDFFPAGSPFFRMHGMYKHQLIKLLVPEQLALGPFLTFDADVVCIREFDEASFIRDGRLISTWEPKARHSWWRNGMTGLSLSTALDAAGLGVTPNVLHSDLCADVLRYLRLRGLDPLDHLLSLAENSPPYRLPGERIPLAWSEYSLYTMVAERFSRLLDYHLSAEAVAASGVRLHSRRNVWSLKQSSRLRPDRLDTGYFLVVQSWAGIAVEDIVARCGLAFG